MHIHCHRCAHCLDPFAGGLLAAHRGVLWRLILSGRLIVAQTTCDKMRHSGMTI
jgi:hypothetical protein